MEIEPPGNNRSPEIPISGDEPSRAEDVDHASESGEAATTYEPNPRLPRERVVVNRDHARAIYEAAQYHALLYSTQAPVASTDHTFILVIEMPSVLFISNSKRSCAWRDVGFVRDLAKIIKDCPNTQLALWTNRSAGGMRQLIKNTVHSLVHTFGLPLHRISFAWTGERSTPAHMLPSLFPPDADPHQLIKDPATVYKALPEAPHASLFLIASSDDPSCTIDVDRLAVRTFATTGITRHLRPV